MLNVKPLTLLLLFHLFIPIYSITIQIGGCNATFKDPEEIKQLLIQMLESNPALIEYNWKTFLWGMAGGFLSACILFLLFYFIAWLLKSKMTYFEEGRKEKMCKNAKKEEAALTGFFLGLTSVYSILQRAKIPYVYDHKDFLGLNYSNAKTAAFFIFGGTFLGLLISLFIAIYGKKKGINLKVMLTAFWGPKFGQLVGMIMYDSGHNIKGFRIGKAFMTLGECLTFSFIGCVVLFTFKNLNRRKKEEELRLAKYSLEISREEKHDIFLEGSIKFAALYYIFSDAGRFD